MRINRTGHCIGDEIGPEDIVVRAGSRRQCRCQRDQADCGDSPEKFVVLANGDDLFSNYLRFLADFSKIRT